MAAPAPSLVQREIEFFGRLTEKTFAQVVDAARRHEDAPVAMVAINASAMQELLDDMGRKKPAAAETLEVPEAVIQVSNFLALRVRPLEPFLVHADAALRYTTLRLTFSKFPREIP